MTNLNLIELNEINFDIVEKYLKKYPGKYPGFERLSSFTKIITSSETRYETIEPWIQWPSIHTCKTYREHQIFRLGDIVHFDGAQIFEIVEDMGYTVGCVSPMNAKNALKQPAYFIPDPWTDTNPDASFVSQALHKALRQAVNDNSKGKISLNTYLTLVWILLSKTQIKNWPTYLKLFKNRKKRWNKALFLDLLLSDVFISLKRKHKEDLSCLFLNAFAHVQHHYILNSIANDGDIRNSEDYVKSTDDPVLDALRIYDRVICTLLNKFNEKFIFATGLRQVPVTHQVIYYRLKNHEEFLIGLGIKNFIVEPRMTRDFLIKFQNSQDLSDAEKILLNFQVDGFKVFEQIERRSNSLFVTLTYSQPINEKTTVQLGNASKLLKDEFVFVAVKNGHHDSQGYVYSNFAPKLMRDDCHVKYIGMEILDSFEKSTSG